MKMDQRMINEEQRFVQFLLSNTPRDYSLIVEYGVIDRLADLETLRELLRANHVIGDCSPVVCLLDQTIHCYLRWLTQTRGGMSEYPLPKSSEELIQAFNHLNQLNFEKRRHLRHARGLDDVYGDSINWIQDKMCTALRKIPAIWEHMGQTQETNWNIYHTKNTKDSIKYILNIADMVLVDVPKLRGWSGDKIVFFFQKFLLKPFSISSKGKKDSFKFKTGQNLKVNLALSRGKLCLMVLLVYRIFSPLDSPFKIIKCLLSCLDTPYNSSVIPQIYESDEGYLLEKYCYTYECLAHILPTLGRKKNKKLSELVNISATPLFKKLNGIYILILKKWEAEADQKLVGSQSQVIRTRNEYSHKTNWSLSHEMRLLYRILFRNKAIADKLRVKFPRDFRPWKRDIRKVFKEVTNCQKIGDSNLRQMPESEFVCKSVINVCNMVIFYQSILVMEVYLPWDPIMMRVAEVCWKRISELTFLDPKPKAYVSEKHHKQFLSQLRQIQSISSRDKHEKLRPRLHQLLASTLSLGIAILTASQIHPVTLKRDLAYFKTCSLDEIKSISDLFKTLFDETEVTRLSLNKGETKDANDLLDIVERRLRADDSLCLVTSNAATPLYMGVSSGSFSAGSNYLT